MAADLAAPRWPADRAREDARLFGLIEQVTCGNEGAISELYDETSSRIYGAVLRMSRSPELAAEVTQEVYLEIWQTLVRIRRDQKQRAGLDNEAGTQSLRPSGPNTQYGIRPRPVCRTQRRPRVRRAGDEVVRSPPAELAGDAMHSLTEIQRQVVTLTYFGGFSQSEVAQILGLPLVTVKARIRDGLTVLRDALGVGT